MNATVSLHNLGQSLWLDNLSRDLLNDGTLRWYISDLSITGVTSNPTIFDHAIKGSAIYDNAIRDGAAKGKQNQELFFDLALGDVQMAADLLSDIQKRTNGLDGWVSLEVPPALAHDTEGTVAAATVLARRADRSNVFIKVPGTKAGLHAVSELIFRGIPINITLLFSPDQYVAAAEAYLVGVERRIEAGLSPSIYSVASVFVSRWDVAVRDRVPEHLRNRLGIAVAETVYGTYRELMASHRWQRALNYGAYFQRLLWASTGTKDPQVSKALYVDALAAPFTIITMPDATLLAISEKEQYPGPMSIDTSAAKLILHEYEALGLAVEQIGAELQTAGVETFSKSWDELMKVLADKSGSLS